MLRLHAFSVTSKSSGASNEPLAVSSYVVKTEFFELADRLCGALHSPEVLLCYLSGERSDFIRFNRALVRQAGTVEQRYLSLRLVSVRRQASATLSLAGDDGDFALCTTALRRLREQLAQLPEDPWLLYSDEPQSTSLERRGRLPPPEQVVTQASSAAKGRDFVGFYAGGTICRGFANSLGQRNWHEVDAFNFDWSLHLAGDKAVKSGYAGFDWDAARFESKLQESGVELDRMRSASRTLAPGEYRAYLAPRALEEVTGLLSWDAFSARAQATRQSALMRMQHGERLSSQVTLTENTHESISPAFQEHGYVKPPAVRLISGGVLGESLVSPRSAQEYKLRVNGANGRESPDALDMAPGDLPEADALTALDTGLYIGNLWYLNFSDKAAGRMTGMTRFATFWVENGRIAGPVAPMRFDDTVYRMLGEKLEQLTDSGELLLSTSTYHERSTGSAHLPGALLGSLRLTL
jgi:predicted Zn-dependent protease